MHMHTPLIFLRGLGFVALAAAPGTPLGAISQAVATVDVVPIYRTRVIRNNLVRVNVDGDHRLDLGVFTLEGLESTMHNKVLNGKLRGIHLPSSLKELELPCCGIAMVREVLHTFHGLYATS